MKERRLAQLPHFLKLLELAVCTQVYRYHDPIDVTSWVGRFMQERKSRICNDVPYVDLDVERLLVSLDATRSGFEVSS